MDCKVRTSAESLELKRPSIPLKTYRWEDVKRSRRRGGYPWTYLYKQPFSEEVDPEDFTMEAMRRSKSSSTFARSEGGVDILEITSENGKSGSASPQPMYQIITEPSDEHDSKDPLRGSIEIEECPSNNGQDNEQDSISSSGNISQYLEKEEPPPIIKEEHPKRARSEETSARKRKLSAESSYSRISLSKLAVVKKLRDVKKKFNTSKISLSSSKLKNVLPKSKKSSPPQAKKEVKRHENSHRPPEKPVYIYIPLKPPDGETDEFSHLEFEEKPNKIEEKVVTLSETDETKPSISSTDDKKPEEEEDIKQPLMKTKRKEPLKINPAFKQLLKDVKKLGEIENQPPLKVEEIEVTKKTDIEVVDKPEEKVLLKSDDSEDMEIDTEEAQDISELKIPGIEKIADKVDINENKNDDTTFDDLFEASTSKQQTLTVDYQQRKTRSKSAEPESKRKSSIDSGYSRKSTSKLSIMKKLKDKIGRTFSLSSLKKEKNEDENTKKKNPKSIDVLKPVPKIDPRTIKPVYIHIPLKPPAGEMDEFSYLEFGDKKETTTTNEPGRDPETSECSSSSPIQTSGVQFIFLTPPSDDETLNEKTPDIPETPSSVDTNFFQGKIDELKILALNAVDRVSPEPERKALDTVKEESPSEKSLPSEHAEETKNLTSSDKTVPSEKLWVDEEDGLSESLKTETPPVIKKKVSFKRKSTSPKKSEYEEISPPTLNETTAVPNAKKSQQVLQASQSMSTEEEKPYLDAKIVKDTSLGDDYNKWSKESDHDHEYEPVNPPEEVTYLTPEQQTIIVPDSSRISTPTTNNNPDANENPGIISKIFHFHSDNEDDETTPDAKKVQQSETVEKKSPNKFQIAFKEKTNQIKTKFHNIKKPNITLPQRPKFSKPDFKKFKIDKPKISLPKMDTSKLTLPSFSLPKRSSNVKDSSSGTANLSIQSNDTVDEKKHKFDFSSTYPRIFKRKPKIKPKETDISSYATNPRSKSTQSEKISSETSSIRIPLHSEDSADKELQEEFDREDSVERRMADVVRNRYMDELEDDYTRENEEINRAEHMNRWQHGNFNRPFSQEEEEFDEHFLKSQAKVTDLDSVEDDNQKSVEGSQNGYSSEASINRPPRQGVLEEIDSDQFILREKGLSQDNIEVGRWISSEIREAFKTPTNNALAQIQDDSNKRKPIKKPKRKKTPHVSQENVSYDDEESEGIADMDIPPSRPRRKSKRNRKLRITDVVPYQETISINDDTEVHANGDRLQFPRESLGILGDDERDEIELQIRGNERIFEANINDNLIGYKEYDFHETSDKLAKYGSEPPMAPPRKHRSLRSLTLSENDSIMADRYSFNQGDITRTAQEIERYIFNEPEPPKRPSRSRSQASSRGQSQKDAASLLGAESFNSETLPDLENQHPCVEEPCMQDIRDYMGYAIVDKNKPREPPLPPPRTTPRRKRHIIEPKFSTVPREREQRLNGDDHPVRPLRNYSTLKQVQQCLEANFYENKENVDTVGYVEIDDDLNRDLHRGEVIEKMKVRPLPAPPRPPRKAKSTRQSLQDITSHENIIVSDSNDSKTEVEEEAKFTQIECDEFQDDIIEQRTELITPTRYTYEETVTHGSLLVQPFSDNKSESNPKERIVSIDKDDPEDEDSVIPEDFAKLKNPTTPLATVMNLETVSAQKFKITDLDVDKLTVNELLANKIIVSEIESNTIQSNDIQASTSDIKFGDVNLSQEFLQKIVESLKLSRSHDDEEEKKTSTESKDTELLLIPPTPPPRSFKSTEPSEVETELPQPSTHQTERMLEPEVDDELPIHETQPPPRPPQPDARYFSQPPASFYALRAEQMASEIIPIAPKRRRHHKSRPISRSRSTESDDSSSGHVRRRHFRRYSDPDIPELAGRLIQACGSTINSSLKRLIYHVTNNVVRNADGQQDMHVMIMILLVLIAGLILLGYGEDKTVVHLHHWEYFNPPKDI